MIYGDQDTITIIDSDEERIQLSKGACSKKPCEQEEMHMPSIGPKAKLPLPAQSSHSLQQLRITYGTEHRRQEGLLSPWPYSALVPTEVKSQGAYAVISLFDGASTTVDIIQSKFAQRPTVLLAAENDPDIRRQVCSIKGYDANEQWRRCEAGYTRFVTLLMSATYLHTAANSSENLSLFVRLRSSMSTLLLVDLARISLMPAIIRAFLALQDRSSTFCPPIPLRSPSLRTLDPCGRNLYNIFKLASGCLQKLRWSLMPKISASLWPESEPSSRGTNSRVLYRVAAALSYRKWMVTLYIGAGTGQTSCGHSSSYNETERRD